MSVLCSPREVQQNTTDTRCRYNITQPTVPGWVFNASAGGGETTAPAGDETSVPGG